MVFEKISQPARYGLMSFSSVERYASMRFTVNSESSFQPASEFMFEDF